ncbi:hypothetical protein D9619_013185 [Psilocybe cf. subviscida]|uniref:Uncharacterized protein n=1 Tax=Psilocybe cf. subviscida TaxID=2480587 RepID=A0A8H5B6Q3_9AGAR|nr:hypothetical protein D9619_013185 [Psilocybe cf. subviscida]
MAKTKSAPEQQNAVQTVLPGPFAAPLEWETPMHERAWNECLVNLEHRLPADLSNFYHSVDDTIKILILERIRRCVAALRSQALEYFTDFHYEKFSNQTPATNGLETNGQVSTPTPAQKW